MEKILNEALFKGAKEAEVYRERGEITTVNFQSNRLKSIDTSFQEGTGLRIIKDGKIGFSSTTNLNDFTSLVKSAFVSAQFGQKALFQFPSPNKINPVNCFDSQVPLIKIEDMIEEGEESIELILKEAPYFECEVEVEKGVSEVAILNSQGLKYSYRKSFYAFSIYAFLAKEKNFLEIEEGEANCQYHPYSTSLAEKIIQQAQLSKKLAKISPGTYPVIFTSKAMPIIFQALKRGINGKMVQKKVSPLLSKLGKPIVSSSINITDDATLPYGISSSPIDAEGIPSHSTPIVREGVLKNFIYDLQTAAILKAKSTANGVRGYDSLPSPSTTNFLVDEGKMSLEDMIADIKEGIIVDQTIGSGQGNVLMGEFSVNLDLGYKIEKGKIVGRIKDIMVSGNSYDLLNRVVGIGKTSRFVGSTKTPPFYFSQISVSG